MKLYIAGPMTGIPHFNFPAFDIAKWTALGKGMDVFSPADNDRRLLGKEPNWIPQEEDQKDNWTRWAIPGAPDLRKMLGDDVAWIAQHATGILMLRGWENSKGARAEHALAIALGLHVFYGTQIYYA